MARLEHRERWASTGQSFKEEEPLVEVMSITAEEILAEIGPVQEVLDAHDGVVNVIDTSDGNIMLSLDGGCNGCSSTPMTAMQIYYSLKKLDYVNDVIFVNGELCTKIRRTCLPH